MRHALVTGGAGFIGSNVAAALIEDGVAVRILDDLSTGHRANVDRIGSAEFIEGSITDRSTVAAAVRGCDVVFHLAASVGNARSVDDPVRDATVNLIGTIEILEAMRLHGVTRIVASSSAGVFGELVSVPIAEDHPVQPDTPYGVSKLASEKAVLASARLHGFDGIALRYFNVYGPAQRFDPYGNVIPIFVFQMLRGEPVTIFGDGEQTRDFVNVADVVQANLRAARAEGVSGTFNIASGTTITINDLAAHLARLVGGNPAIGHGDPRPGDVLHSVADITAARSAFGFDPAVTLEAGLAEYVAWARSEVDQQPATRSEHP